MEAKNRSKNRFPLHSAEIWFHLGSLMNCLGENLPNTFEELNKTHCKILEISESDLTQIRQKYWFKSLSPNIAQLNLMDKIDHNTMRTGDVVYFLGNREAYMLFGQNFKQLF